jgi:hypothetical protein
VTEDAHAFEIEDLEAPKLAGRARGSKGPLFGATRHERVGKPQRSQALGRLGQAYIHFQLRFRSRLQGYFTRRPDFAPSVFVFLWPLFYLIAYLLPYDDIALRTGNDFWMVYYKYKVYLLDVLSSDLRVPLWSPSEGGGYPFYSNPFVAAFYPLNLPLVIFYRLTGGYTSDDHQVFTILGICILCLGIYRWLRSLGSAIRPALFAALVMGTSMKVTELMRFPNAVHAAAWMPWILLGITRALRRSSVPQGLGIMAAATIMILTAGYPYYVYYLPFLLIPYILLLLFRKTREVLYAARVDDKFVGMGKGLLLLLAGFGAPLLLLSPYLWKMLILLAQTTDRGGLDFQFSTRHTWTILDTLGSLVFPPAATAEGWYYFGIVGLLLILLWLRGAWADPTVMRRDAFFSSIILAWFVLVTFITLGKASFLFDLFWRCLPGFSRLQAWPRLNIILVPILAMLLARAYAWFEGLLTRGEGVSRPGLGSQMRRLVLFSALIAAAQIWFLTSGYESDYWGRYFSGLKYVGKEWFLAAGLISLGILAAVMPLLYRRSLCTPFGATILMLLLFFGNTLSIGQLGVRQWSRAKVYSPRRQLDISEVPARALGTPRMAIYDTIQLGASYNVGIISHWYYKRYTDFMGSALSLEDGQILQRRLGMVPGLKTFMGIEDGRRVFFTHTLVHSTVKSFVEDDRTTRSGCGASAKVLAYDGDTLDAVAETRCPAYFSFIDNWDPDWRGEVNGQPVRIEATFGTFKAVHLEAGASRIRFVYSPFSWPPGVLLTRQSDFTGGPGTSGTF